MSRADDIRMAVLASDGALRDRRQSMTTIPRENLALLCEGAQRALETGACYDPPQVGRSFATLKDGRHIAFEMPFDMSAREVEFARALFDIQIGGSERRGASKQDAAVATEEQGFGVIAEGTPLPEG